MTQGYCFVVGATPARSTLVACQDRVAADWNAAEAHSLIVAICMAGPIAHSSSARHRGEDPAG